MKPISDYMSADTILFLNGTNRNLVLQELVQKVYEKKHIPDPDKFYQAICEREKLVSTGIGMGVALPHAKIGGLDHFFIAIAILRKGIDWNSLDAALVRIIFLIGGPDDQQTEYLQILSKLTLIVKKEEIRKKMLTLNSKEAILRLFSHGFNT